MDADGAGPVPGSLVAALRADAPDDEVPLLSRTIDMHVFDRERDGLRLVIGSLNDERPWASGQFGPRHVHGMDLAIVVRTADLTIVDAHASMGTFPHAECPDIEGSFADLIGLSVSRGYTAAVQERFGRQRGCSHLEFLARALGPVVIQAIAAWSAKEMEARGGAVNFGGDGALHWLTNTCHVWADGGVGEQKLGAGWRPVIDGYPAPSLVSIRRRARRD
jgi:hypothetical protein